MAKATIKIEDTSNDKVNIRVIFNPKLDMKTEGKKLTNAQFLALDLLEQINKIKMNKTNEGENNGEE